MKDAWLFVVSINCASNRPFVQPVTANCCQGEGCLLRLMPVWLGIKTS